MNYNTMKKVLLVIIGLTFFNKVTAQYEPYFPKADSISLINTILDICIYSHDDYKSNDTIKVCIDGLKSHIDCKQKEGYAPVVILPYTEYTGHLNIIITIGFHGKASVVFRARGWHGLIDFEKAKDGTWFYIIRSMRT